ncbi:NAD(P)/FAD-dependent oxidoreductase [Proteinivorax hydrogeniformans]|uniref:NAD(P)/FAD-dependent oxidoreductase n=1 Tax=Proteinivorax hydrogeniformans TaxID=1826727 RepID=A0AAU8HUI4_9FIRM
MSTRYDIAIVGSGPAGLSAALNAKIRGKNFIIFGSDDLSNKLIKAKQIDNYLGFPNVSGIELKNSFVNHLNKMDINITNEKINNIYAMGDYYALMANDQVYEASTIILASGVNFGKPFKGEEEFLGKGVGYCATCDAALYKNKIVAVIAQNKKDESEANFLSTVASKVYYIPMYKEEISVNKDIEVVKDIPLKITGVNKADQLVLKNTNLDIDGVFILRDSISPAHLVPGLSVKNNHVEVDNNMKTNLDGCFAAGDIVGQPHQYIKAAGEGNIAALSACSYLDSKDK